MKEVMETYAFLANQSLFGAVDQQTDATSTDGPDRVANMTKVDRCRCTWSRHETIKALMSQNTTASSISVSDSGADSCIIDDAWAIEYTYGPKVNGLGFDSNIARKKNCSIERAVTVVTDENGRDIIVRVHYGVHNEGAIRLYYLSIN